MTETALIAARFAHYAALVLAFGAFAYAGFGARSPTVGGRSGRLGLWASLLLLIAAGSVLAATVAGLGGGMSALSDLTLWSAVVEETDFGRVWSVRLLLAVVLVGVAVGVWRRPARPWSRLGALVAGALVLTVALTGHAQAEEGTPGLVHRVADAAHLLAAAVWLGALPPLLVLLRKTPAGSVEDPDAAAARLQAFHATGLVAVVALALTGVVNSWFLVGSPERLVTTTYGGVLLAKLALFAGMVALAADNRFRLAPALSRDRAGGLDGESTLDRLRSRIRGELALGMLVLFAVAVLGAIAPAST